MNKVERLLGSPIGAVIARPWMDGAVLGFLTHWFFPLSRLWAAARAAHGSPSKFLAEVPLAAQPTGESLLIPVLDEFEVYRAAASAAERQWEAAFFSGGHVGPTGLHDIERERLKCRAKYNSMRRNFSFLRRGNDIPSIRWDLRSPIQTAVDYARAMRYPQQVFSPPEAMPQVQASESYVDGYGRHYWLRFLSPSEKMADTVTARVLEPLGVVDPPTVIFLNGICVEFDHWNGMINDVGELSRNGVRTIRVEAPWHGRRVADGRYGGEKFIGTMPLGSLEYFSAQVREISVLMDWCRSRSDKPVALGGSSLGAHVARLIATRSRNWRTSLQPDALLLITPCEKIEDAAIHGAFANVWKTAENSVEIGWTPELRDKFFRQLDPLENPCVPADRTIAVLGTHDRVTPFPSGQRLVERLQLPSENIYIRRQGHFSTPVNLMRDKAPLTRFCQLLNGSPPRAAKRVH
ncbi:MAG: hypothetical protein KJO31_17960 [Gammaproteobacteria bacterium]|nr:hypothetical protein [Gammaproteobacteria bacterium]